MVISSLQFTRMKNSIDCIYSDAVSFISAKPYGPRVTSFFVFSKEEIILLPETISSILKSFKLLRVLEEKYLRFIKFPSELTHLIHLRYLVLSSDFEILPNVIVNLWKLQTLIVGTTSHALDIKVYIWKMVELRHLEKNASSTLLKKEKVEDKNFIHWVQFHPKAAPKNILTGLVA